MIFQDVGLPGLTSTINLHLGVVPQPLDIHRSAQGNAHENMSQSLWSQSVIKMIKNYIFLHGGFISQDFLTNRN